jgi:hypothetical protein
MSFVGFSVRQQPEPLAVAAEAGIGQGRGQTCRHRRDASVMCLHQRVSSGWHYTSINS